MHSGKYSDAGFTGLEAAIVLIAFVVVAAVFSYVVLGAGFFTTQKAQQTVHTSVIQSSSSLIPAGDIYAVTAPGGTAGTIQWINFSVELSPGGTPIDFDKVTLIYSNQTILETLQKGNWGNSPAPITPGQWAVVAVDHEVNQPNHLLDIGEQFEITAYPAQPIFANDVINVEILPPVGTSFTITRTLPPALQPVNNLL